MNEFDKMYPLPKSYDIKEEAKVLKKLYKTNKYLKKSLKNDKENISHDFKKVGSYLNQFIKNN